MKFFILSTHSSGTRMLCSMLNSHPDLTCWGELYSGSNPYRRPVNILKDGEGGVIMYRQWFRLSPKDKELVRSEKVIHLIRSETSVAESRMRSYEEESYSILEIVQGITLRRMQVFKIPFPNLIELTYESITSGNNTKSYSNPLLTHFLGVRDITLHVSDDVYKGMDGYTPFYPEGKEIWRKRRKGLGTYLKDKEKKREKVLEHRQMQRERIIERRKLREQQQ